MSTLLFVVAVLEGVAGKLLQINEWHRFPFSSGQKTSLDFSLFLSCDRFTIVFSTPDDELSRLKLRFNKEVLRKIDVDSLEDVEAPKIARLVGGCKEIDRKSFRINITSYEDSYSIQIGDQKIRRPKKIYANRMEVLIPQIVPCCLIRGILLTEHQDFTRRTTMSFRLSPKFRIEYKSPAPINSTQPKNDPHALFPADPFVRLEVPTKSWTVPGILTLEFNQPTFPPTTSSHEYQLLSWTDIVNREWSTAFLVCSLVILTIMIIMVAFALSMFVYLQTKPKRGRRLRAVDD